MTDYLITPERIQAVIGFVTSEDKAIAALDRIASGRKEDRAKIFADWKTQKIEDKHFTKPKKGENEHAVINAFLNDLAIYATPIGRGNDKQYLTEALVAEYKDEALGAAHKILGRPKMQPKGAAVTNWQAQIGSTLSKLKKGYADYLADLAAPAEKKTVTKTTKTQEQIWMEIIQKRYAATQKADFKMPDADLIKKGLHMIAQGVTGKEGQIKTGDKTKK
jgi:hypothetical protein